MNYKVASKKATIGKFKGQTVYYAQAQRPRVISFEEVAQDISEQSTLTSGDIRNAIDRLAYVLRRELSVGNTVQLGQIGTFSIQASSRHVAREEEVNASVIRRPRVRLYLHADLKQAVHSLHIEVDNPKAKSQKGTSVVSSSVLTAGGETDPGTPSSTGNSTAETTHSSGNGQGYSGL